MTEKRLIVDEDYNIVDTETGEWLDDTQVFDLANELHEENEQLKSENNMLKHTIGRNESYIATLTHKGKWKDTSKPLHRSISRGD